jgi:alpha-beta hydrolase superfamily lysophospholipase
MVTSATPGPLGPGPIEPTTTLRISSRDGTRLHGELYEVASPRGAALIIHGYAEHAGRYREVAHVLQRAGLAALALDLRGHGRSGGRRGTCLQFSEYLDDVDAALAALGERLPRGLPVGLVCHSHGSLVGLRLLADPTRCPPQLRCAVLASPFLALRMKVPRLKILTAKVLGRVLPSFAIPSGLPAEWLTRDPERLAARRSDTLCHEVAGVRWGLEMSAAQQWVAEFAPRIQVPTLWLVAGEDRVVDPEVTRQVFDRTGGDRRWHRFDRLFHEVFNEPERGAVFEVMNGFLEEAFSS